MTVVVKKESCRKDAYASRKGDFILRAIRRLAFSCFFSFVTIQAAFSEVPTSPAWLEAFDAVAEVLIQSNQPPGIAIAIVTPERLVALKTKGVRQLGQEQFIDEDTIFRVCSLSKCCTSALIAQLAARGRLDLEAPIGCYLPDVQVSNPVHTRALKVKHLLAHTTGLPRCSLELEAYRRQSFKMLVKRLKAVNAISTPGKIHQYQNVLYSLLGPIVERVTQQRFTTHLRESLLEPLGIHCYALSEQAYASCGNMAYPHLRSRCGLLGNHYKVHEPSSYYDNILPAAGMGFSIKGMATLLQAFMGGYPTLLDSELLAKCHSPVALVSKGNKGCRKQQCHCRRKITEYYGLGWRIRHLKNPSYSYHYHGGMVDGYMSWMGFSKEKNIGIVVLMNASKSRLPAMLGYSFFKTLFDKDHQLTEGCVERYKALVDVTKYSISKAGD